MFFIFFPIIGHTTKIEYFFYKEGEIFISFFLPIDGKFGKTFRVWVNI